MECCYRFIRHPMIRHPQWFLVGLVAWGFLRYGTSPVFADGAIATFEPPPGEDAPAETTAGGQRRRPLCPEDNGITTLPLISLVPTNRFGLTATAHPTVLVYVPRTTARSAQFQLFDAQHQLIQERVVSLKSQGQIIDVSWPQSAVGLSLNQDYRWSFTVLCDSGNSHGAQQVDGWIRRIPLSPIQRQRLEAASPEQRALMYAQSGIWYDALTQLAQLKATTATSLSLQQAWKQLLDGADLPTLAAEPIIFSHD